MTRKLTDADRQAVDMMFDRITSTAQDASSDQFVAVADGVNGQRLRSVEEILNMLEMMPAADPPADLAVRTLQHIARRTGAVTPAATAGFIDPSQPIA